MGRAHTGYDVYVGDGDDAPLTHKQCIIHEDVQRRVLKVRSKDDRGRWEIVRVVTETSRPQRSGTALRWSGVGPDGQPEVLTAISNRGGCIPCGRR